MKKLLIYVPSYLGRERLTFFISRFMEEAQHYTDMVGLHINDNGSGSNYLENIIRDKSIKITQNESNEGIAKNINKVFHLNSEYEYTWILGDDDYLTKGSIARLLSSIENFDSPDFLFLNTASFPLHDKKRVIDFFNTKNSLPMNLGRIKGTKYLKPTQLSFSNLLDPKIDEVLLGSLMCGVFKTSIVKDHSSYKFPDYNELSVWSAYPHVINYARSFSPQTNSVIDPFIFTFNFWDGGNTWKHEYDIVMAFGLLNSIKHYSQNGHLTHESEIRLIKHYLSISSESLERLIDRKDANFSDQLHEVLPYFLSIVNKSEILPNTRIVRIFNKLNKLISIIIKSVLKHL